MEQITCDLIPGGKMPLLHASQYDEGREYHINLTENKQAYTLDGTELLTVSVRKGDNTLFTADIANTFGGKSYVDFVSTEQMCACAGFSFGELSITKNNTRIGTVNFMLVCEPSPEASGLTSESEINNLNRQIDDYLDETLPDVLDDDVPPIVERVIDETLAPVAKSGSYNDLTDKPTIPEQVQSDWNEADNTKPDYIKNKPNLSTVATSGSYNDLLNKPSIPAAQVNSDWNANSGVSQILNKPNLATVATSGNYNDLNNKPSVAVIDDTQASASKVYSSNKVDSLIDNLPEPSEVGIDDSKTLSNKTWSSNKINTEISEVKTKFDNTFSNPMTATNEEATLGEELISDSGWVLGTGWSGSFAEGFTHSSGTSPLEFPISGIEANKMYYVEFASTVDLTNTNLLVTVGNSDTFPLYGMPQPYKVGMIAKNTDNLKFLPENGFTGKITVISIKEVTGISAPCIMIVDTDEENAIEMRSGKLALGNVFVGEETGKYNVSGFGNVALGKQALANNIGGFWNVGIGLTALKENSSGSRNVAVGYGALLHNVAGHRNIALGSFALLNNINGYGNVSIGADTLDENTSGFYNVAIGFQSLYHNTTGSRNVALGQGAGQSLTTGSDNLIVGSNSLASATSSSNNIAIGASVMSATNGNGNVAIGSGSLYKNTNGTNNVVVGTNAGAGSNNATQSQNVFIGAQSGYKIYNGVNQNTFAGYKAGYSLVSGHNNVCIGAEIDVPNASTSDYTSINDHLTGSKTTGSEWTQVLGDLIVKGTDGVKRQIVFNNDNTISWVTVS